MHTDLEDLLLQSFYGYLHLVTVVSELKSKGKVDRRKERSEEAQGKTQRIQIQVTYACVPCMA